MSEKSQLYAVIQKESILQPLGRVYQKTQSTMLNASTVEKCMLVNRHKGFVIEFRDTALFFMTAYQKMV